MRLSEAGVARVRGYLFVLERSLQSRLPAGGNWVIAIGVGTGIAILILTHWGARAFLAWYRERRTPGFTPLI